MMGVIEVLNNTPVNGGLLTPIEIIFKIHSTLVGFKTNLEQELRDKALNDNLL
jgi:hypothetical protein